jgi:rod shape-determining protein MreC
VDKQIRRRRAVLLLLVVVSLILLTDYFGESSDSPLHSVQRGIVEVLSPVQDGASKVLSPVRDVAGWVSSTANAKSKLNYWRDKYYAQTKQLAALQTQRYAFQQEQGLVKLDNSYNLHAYGLQAANVIEKNALVWYETIRIDKGTSSGIKPNDPVVGPGGLVGNVSSEVGSGYAVINLLTSPNFAVGAMVNGNAGSAGLVQTAVGDPSTLVMNHLSSSAQVSPDDLVVTSGFKYSVEPSVQSLYPAGIPIGTVSNENPQTSVQTNQQVNVAPLADLADLSVVQVLTRPHAGS